MNSSTSNSKISSGARKMACIGLSLLLCFGIAEMGARKYARRRQNDLSDPKNFTSIGARAQNLMRQKGLKIVFVGNSATQEGTDLRLFEQIATTQTGGTPVHATQCTATDSGVKDWNWMLDKGYFGPKRRPDLFVVTWFSANLQDTPVVDRGRLAQFFTSPRDWPEVFRTDVTTLGERCDFVFSYLSVLFAMREVTQEKLLRAGAPGYEKWALQLNDLTRQQAEARENLPQNQAKARESEPQASYQALERLLRRARENRAKLCFVAYPRRDARYAYPISRRAAAMIRQAGMTFLDLRQAPQLSPDKYKDSVHVNEQGRTVWTRHIAQQLAPQIRALKSALR